MQQNTSVTAHPYATFLHLAERPARYTGGEWGSITKPWDSTHVRICLAFPDIYDVGMSHLGTRILYDMLNKPNDMLCERAFCPWLDMEELLREHDTPLVSLENHKPLSDFHVVGISLQHELVYTNVLTLLDLGGIPLRAADRKNDDPLVVGGGSIATHPEPIAPFFDALVVGDGEAKAEQVARTWVRDLDNGLSRRERLTHLASLGGVYVPSLYERTMDPISKRVIVSGATVPEAPLPIERAFVENLDDFPFPAIFPTGGPEAVFDRFSIELARGCSQGCRFCQAGMIFRPERERSPKAVLASIDEAITRSGQDEFSLTSLSPADYTAIKSVVREASKHVRDKHVTMNVSSLRAYGLTDDTLEQIRQVRASNLTFAPEAGTQRLRDVINKNITEEQIIDTVRRVVRLGWSRIKLYFMIGLPTETEEDIEGILLLSSQVRQVARQSKGKARATQVTSSASTFVPKPHTPLQWAEMIDLERVRDKHEHLRSRARQLRVDIKMHESHGSILEGIMSRGDIRLADVVEAAWKRGARFDAWDGHVDWKVWTEVLSEHGLDLASWLEAIPVQAQLPWQHIDPGVDRDFLLREWNKAWKGQLSRPCLRPADYIESPDADHQASASEDQKLVCLGCGLDCDMSAAAERRANVAHELLRSVSEPGSSVTSSQPTRQHSPEVVTYRLNYEKTDTATYWGHLDLVREMPRILRRAGLDLAYSQGFHPKPIMTFGPALSLGVPGLDEYVDVRVQKRWQGKRPLEQELDEQSPRGLRFLRVEQFDEIVTAVGKRVAQADLVLGLPKELVARHGGPDWLRERVSWLLAQREVTITRIGKKRRARQLDVRPFVLRLEVVPHEDLFKHVGIAGSWETIETTLRQEQSGSVRLSELIGVLTEQNDWPYRAVRVKLRGPAGEDVLTMA